MVKPGSVVAKRRLPAFACLRGYLKQDDSPGRPVNGEMEALAEGVRTDWISRQVVATAKGGHRVWSPVHRRRVQLDTPFYLLGSWPTVVSGRCGTIIIAGGLWGSDSRWWGRCIPAALTLICRYGGF